MTRLELYHFDYYDELRRRWLRARYVAELEVIKERYPRFRLVGGPEVRDVPDDPLYSMATGRLAS